MTQLATRSRPTSTRAISERHRSRRRNVVILRFCFRPLDDQPRAIRLDAHPSQISPTGELTSKATQRLSSKNRWGLITSVYAPSVGGTQGIRVKRSDPTL